MFDFPTGLIGGSTVNCGFQKQNDESYAEATGKSMASEVVSMSFYDGSSEGGRRLIQSSRRFLE